MVDLENPSAYGVVCGADFYSPLKLRRQRDMLGVTQVWSEVSAEFAARFKREHPPVEAYLTSDAEVVIVSIGTAAGAACMAADTLRSEGVPAGSLRLSLMRPFPVDAVLKELSTAEDIVVLDRDISFGAEGIVAQEIKACLYGNSSARVHGLVTGIGGVDVTDEKLAAAVRSLTSSPGPPKLLGKSFWLEASG
jgi:pyruvate ferredoxin oxidoreductase alpha subunit